MSVTKSIREMNAVDLVKEWRKRVNQNIALGRDAHMIKLRLEYLTPSQVLLGIYQYVGEKTISIPQFLEQEEDWLVKDEISAEIELAAAVSHTHPPAYRIWRDLRFEEPTPYSLSEYTKAKQELLEWAEKVLG